MQRVQRRKGTFDGHFVRERGINGASLVITDPRRVIDNLMNRSCRDKRMPACERTGGNEYSISTCFR